MAKKVANMKERKAAEEERNNKRRNTRETVRRRADGSHKNRYEISLSLDVLCSSSVHVTELVRRSMIRVWPSRARTDPGMARPVTRCHETPGSSPPATLA